MRAARIHAYEDSPCLGDAGHPIPSGRPAFEDMALTLIRNQLRDAESASTGIVPAIQSRSSAA